MTAGIVYSVLGDEDEDDTVVGKGCGGLLRGRFGDSGELSAPLDIEEY